MGGWPVSVKLQRVDRLACVVVAPFGGRIRCQDRSFDESIGWRDIVIGITVLVKVHVVVAFSVGGFLAAYISMLTGSMEIREKGRVTVSISLPPI